MRKDGQMLVLGWPVGLKTSVTYSGHLGDQYISQKMLFKFSFFSYISVEKYLEAAVDDFRIHQLFQNGLEDKSAERREKQRDKEVEVKEETSMKAFSFI